MLDETGDPEIATLLCKYGSKTREELKAAGITKPTPSTT